jgi:hypothetical protein
MSQQSLFITTPLPVSTMQPPSLISLSYRAAAEKVAMWEIRHRFKTEVFVSSRPKEDKWHLTTNEFWYWDRIIESGKSYMVGDMPTQEYLRKFSSPLSKWQKLAYVWAIENPDSILDVETSSHEWQVYTRGEYVEFSLPHQDKGGERNYVTRNGKTKVLVNED